MLGETPLRYSASYEGSPANRTVDPGKRTRVLECDEGYHRVIDEITLLPVCNSCTGSVLPLTAQVGTMKETRRFNSLRD